MEATKPVEHIKTLVCNCCGNYTKGRQWWNRDNGYGICQRCGDEQAERSGLKNVEFDNGKKGYHWGIIAKAEGGSNASNK